MEKYVSKVKELLIEFKQYNICQIIVSKNLKTDALAKLAAVYET